VKREHEKKLGACANGASQKKPRAPAGKTAALVGAAPGNAVFTESPKLELQRLRREMRFAVFRPRRASAAPVESGKKLFALRALFCGYASDEASDLRT
jgi:hypothetical protein